MTKQMFVQSWTDVKKFYIILQRAIHAALGRLHNLENEKYKVSTVKEIRAQYSKLQGRIKHAQVNLADFVNCFDYGQACKREQVVHCADKYQKEFQKLFDQERNLLMIPFCKSRSVDKCNVPMCYVKQSTERRFFGLLAPGRSCQYDGQAPRLPDSLKLRHGRAAPSDLDYVR